MENIVRRELIANNKLIGVEYLMENDELIRVELEGLNGIACIDFKVTLTETGEEYYLGFDLATRDICSWQVLNQDVETRKSKITGRTLNEALKDIEDLDDILCDILEDVLDRDDSWMDELSGFEMLINVIGEAPTETLYDEDGCEEIIIRKFLNGARAVYNIQENRLGIITEDDTIINIDEDDDFEYIVQFI